MFPSAEGKYVSRVLGSTAIGRRLPDDISTQTLAQIRFQVRTCLQMLNTASHVPKFPRRSFREARRLCRESICRSIQTDKLARTRFFANRDLVRSRLCVLAHNLCQPDSRVLLTPLRCRFFLAWFDVPGCRQVGDFISVAIHPPKAAGRVDEKVDRIRSEASRRDGDGEEEEKSSHKNEDKADKSRRSAEGAHPENADE